MNQIFDQLDSWRYLPNYQLERRTDIFFAMYLPEVLQQFTGIPIMPTLIPEFPVRRGSVDVGGDSNRSFKIDYLAFSQNRETVFFVELKTEMKSRRSEQDRDLKAAQAAGMAAILRGLLEIMVATNERGKYYQLLKMVETMGLVKLPKALDEMAESGRWRGISEVLSAVTINPVVRQCEIVYVQPSSDGPNTIDFEAFAAVVAAHPDPVSARFAESLRRWAQFPV